MKVRWQRYVAGVFIGVWGVTAAVAEEPVLNVYNWSDYIADDTLENFTRETGIRVVYDVFDSNDTLEAKLLAGSSGYDVVVPSMNFMGRQIKAGVFQPLDKSKLPNLSGLDPKLMEQLAIADAGNNHGVPYMWGTTGIGYNPDKVRQALGDDAPVDSWALVFDPANLARLHQCGVAMLDAADEIIPSLLQYLGEDPNSRDSQLLRGKAREHLLKLRPYVTYFHSSKYIDDLANGDICVAIGWSGDIFQAADDAAEGVTVHYVIPKEGAMLWFDVLGIPRDAKHPENAHTFINYLLRPEVMAKNSNAIWYANAVLASKAMIEEEIRNHPGIYPNDETMAKLFVHETVPPAVDRILTRVWTEVKTGR